MIDDIVSGKKSSDECLQFLFRDGRLRRILHRIFTHVEKSREKPGARFTMLALSRALMHPLMSAFLTDLGRYMEDHRYRCEEPRKVIKMVAHHPVNLKHYK